MVMVPPNRAWKLVWVKFGPDGKRTYIILYVDDQLIICPKTMMNLNRFEMKV